MTRTIELSNPIEIDGEMRKELAYDSEQLTISQFAAAEGAAKKKTTNVVGMSEFDYTFHFYIGAYSVIAVNPSIDITDIERVRGKDLMKLVEVGRFFTTRLDEQGEESSGGPSEITQESSQHPSGTSTDGQSSPSSSTTERQ